MAESSKIRFTVDMRERFLTLLERGDSIEDACADVGISRATVTKWAARGRRPDAPDDGSAEFAFRFDELREGRNEPSLSQDDVIRLLEKAARKGSVQAMKHLIDRPWEKKDGASDGQDAPEAEQDPFAALEGNELAQRRAKRRASSA
jgi:transposase